jgi:hypothetical protein
MEYVDLDRRITLCNALQHVKRTERIAIALNNKRRAPYRLQRSFVVWSRPAAGLNWMRQHDECSRRLEGGETCTYAPSERATDQRDTLHSFRKQLVTSAPNIILFRLEIICLGL